MKVSETKEYYVYVLEIKSSGELMYIGKGTGTRYRQHRYVANQPRKDGVYLYRKIRKLWENGDDFTSRIIFRTFDEKEALNKEELLIAIIGKENLCNLSDGGEKGGHCPVPLEVRQKISKANSGKIKSKETINRIRETKRNNPYKYTEEQLEKSRAGFLSDKDRLDNLKTHTLNRATKVKRLDNEAIYPSMCEAAKELGCSPNSIAQAIKENRPCLGVKFEILEDNNKLKSKIVHRLDTNEYWYNLKDAAESIDISKGHLHFCLKNNKHCNGIMFEYSDNVPEELIYQPKQRIVDRNKILCLDNDVVFENIDDAAVGLECTAHSLWNSVNKQRKHKNKMFVNHIPFEEILLSDPSANNYVRRTDDYTIPEMPFEVAATHLGVSKETLYNSVKLGLPIDGVIWEYSIDLWNKEEEIRYLPTCYV